MTERRSKSYDGRGRKKYGNTSRISAEYIFDSGNIGDDEEETLEEIIETGSGEGAERVLTNTNFFYDIRVLRHPKKKNGTTKGGLWIHLLIWFGFIIYTALFVMEGLEIVEVGWDNPFFYFILHAVLMVYFGILFVYSGSSFMIEAMLSDNLRPAIVTGHGFFTNGISFILFLIWIVKNTNLIFDTNYDKNPQATIDYKDVVIVCFVAYVIWITLVILTYMVRYAFAKFIEILSKIVRQMDKNPKSDYLETLLYKADRYLKSGRKYNSGFRDCTDEQEEDIEMMRRPKKTKRNKVRSRTKRSRSRGRNK